MKRAIARRSAICIGMLMLAVASTASADGGVNPFISNCRTISQPGSYLVLANITATASNIQNNGLGWNACIMITADFVTLDLGGHTIVGPPAATVNFIPVMGIVSFNNGTEVRSGIVTTFWDGVALLGAGARVEHIRALNNSSHGIIVEHEFQPFLLQGHRVVANTAIGNSIGITVYCPSVVLENVATGNTTGDIVEVNPGAGACTRQENSPAP